MQRSVLPSNAGMLSDKLFAAAHAPQAIDAGQIRERAGFEDIGGKPSAADLFAGMFQLDLHFAEGFLAFSDGADAVIGQGDRDSGETLDGGVNRVNRAVADGR